MTRTPSPLPLSRTTPHQIPLGLNQLHEATVLLGQRCVAYHPKLAQLTGRVTAGLMLSQAIYWTRKLALAEPARLGWFWKTRDDWRSETGLSRREQDSARLALKQLELWQERRVGMPAKVWYRVDLDTLGRRLEPELFNVWDWRNERALLQLLGRPYLFYRSLSEITGAATAALLMSNLLAQERALLKTGEALAGWRRYQFDHLLRHTGLSRHELDHARRLLRQGALVAERRIGLPPRVEWQIRLEHLCALLAAGNSRPGADDTVLRQPITPTTEPTLGELSGNVPSSSLENQLLELRTMAIQTAGFRHADFAETSPLDLPNRTDWRSGNVPTVWADSVSPDGRFPENLYVFKTTGFKTPPPTPAASAEANQIQASSSGGRWFEDLIWPQSLRPEERESACRLLAPVASQAQLLLDELAGQALQHKRIDQPLNYLSVLARKAVAGEFIPTTAQRELARREAFRHERDAPATEPRVGAADRRQHVRDGLATLRAFMAERMGSRQIE
ncbi:MAG: hypothetical protein IPG66_06040 [Hydrogenophilales bacterium]|nr:hypothetical protein [Hydrogenophilales bacterium]